MIDPFCPLHGRALRRRRRKGSHGTPAPVDHLTRNEEGPYLSSIANVRRGIARLWKMLSPVLIMLLVMSNGGLIFKTVYGLPVGLFSLFLIKNFNEADLQQLTNAPWFMLGVFTVFTSLGLLVRSRIAWSMCILLLTTTFIYTLHFYAYMITNLTLCAFTILILLLARKDFSKSNAAGGTIFTIVSLITLLFYSSYGALYFGDGFKPEIFNLETAFYYAVVTMTTVGYGDIVPVSQAARLFAVSIIVSGIALFATSITTIFGPLISGSIDRLMKGEKHKMDRSDHFIICGVSPLAINTLKQLTLRGRKVTLVTSRQEVEQTYGNVYDVLHGDITDETILRQAGVEKAKAVLALSEDDANNAFVVLSAKDISKDVKTVIAVSDSKNIGKLKRVQPDIILAPQLFGSEILARILNEEKIDNDMLISMLLSSAASDADKHED